MINIDINECVRTIVKMYQNATECMTVKIGKTFINAKVTLVG